MTDPRNSTEADTAATSRDNDPHTNDAGDTTEHAAEPLFWVSQTAARTVLIVLHVLAFGAVIFEWLFPLYSDGYKSERVQALDFTGSYAVYGFVSCVILVLLGLVLRRLVMRPENFYREEGQ